jgi:hypothetical protein
LQIRSHVSESGERIPGLQLSVRAHRNPKHP